MMQIIHCIHQFGLQNHSLRTTWWLQWTSKWYHPCLYLGRILHSTSAASRWLWINIITWRFLFHLSDTLVGFSIKGKEEFSSTTGALIDWPRDFGNGKFDFKAKYKNISVCNFTQIFFNLSWLTQHSNLDLGLWIWLVDNLGPQYRAINCSTWKKLIT